MYRLVVNENSAIFVLCHVLWIRKILRDLYRRCYIKRTPLGNGRPKRANRVMRDLAALK